MKKFVFFTVCLLALGLAFITCDRGDTAIAVTLTSVTANGNPAGGALDPVTTTELTLTFDRPVPGLRAADITLSGIEGVSTGVLRGAGPAVYHLPIFGFTDGGTLNVSVSRSGYNISGAQQTVTIHHRDPGNIAITLMSVTANGRAPMPGPHDTVIPGITTTELTLNFIAPIPGLTAANISFLPLGTLVQADALTGPHDPPSVFQTGYFYTLTISGFPENTGTIFVIVERDGFSVSPPMSSVRVFHADDDPSTVLFSVVANGNVSTTTTELTFTFDGEVDGLSADHIHLSGAVIGTTTIPSLNTFVLGTLSAPIPDGEVVRYILPISGIVASEIIRVEIIVPGASIVGVPRGDGEYDDSTKHLPVFHSSSAGIVDRPIEGRWIDNLNPANAWLGFWFFEDGTYWMTDEFKASPEEEGTWVQQGNIVLMTTTIIRDQVGNNHPLGVPGARSTGLICAEGYFTVADWKFDPNRVQRRP